ncbi:MAG: hypothetical protein ABEL76_10945 [Bradymonadaceae bacterium]
MWKRILAATFVATLIASSSCQCRELDSDPWLLEPADSGRADAPPVDAPVDTSDAADAVDTTDVADVPDVADVRDAREDVDAWQRDNVVSNIQCREVLTDRTSLVIDDRGTVWLGFHQFQSPDCERSNLVVARRPVGGRWQVEEIARHRGIFGLEIIDPGEPLLVYPHPSRSDFRTAKRVSPGNWTFHTFDVSAVTTSAVGTAST